MQSTLVLVHTVPPLVAEFTRLAAEMLPGVHLLHVLDEPLLARIKQRGGADAQDAARLASHIQEAADVGADAVLVTCSTVSPLVAQVRGTAPVPVVPIDEAMVVEAVRLGTRIAVIATNATTLAPTRRLLEAEAAARGRTLALELMLVDGALDALLAGGEATHDRLVAQAVTEAAARADVIVLAQASMARALASLPPPLPVPVLASSALALRHIVALLQAQPASVGERP